MPLGNGHIVRANLPALRRVIGVWTGGGAAANCTHTSTDWSTGISSVNYNAATGKYKITFTDVGQQIVAHGCKVSVPTTESSTDVNVIVSSFSIANKTVEIELWDKAATPALVDLETDEKLLVDITFASYAP